MPGSPAPGALAQAVVRRARDHALGALDGRHVAVGLVPEPCTAILRIAHLDVPAQAVGCAAKHQRQHARAVQRAPNEGAREAG